MATKPILFSTPMVRAILDGRKTVTRRVIKPQHLAVLDSPYHREHPEVSDRVLLEKLCQPPYSPGDVLYVRETFCPYDKGHIIDGKKYVYKSDATNYSESLRKEFGYKWRPSIHMPKEAARIFLRVTDVRVERLRSIDEEQAKAEGANFRVGIEDKFRRSVIDRFAEIWDSTIKPKDRDKYGWAANPWVWVIEFQRISREKENK